MSPAGNRAARRAQKRHAAAAAAGGMFGPCTTEVETLLGRVGSASAEQLAAIAAANTGSTIYLTSIGSAWNAARKAGLFRQAERASAAAFHGTPDHADRTVQQRAADAASYAALAVVLGNKLPERYAATLLAPLAALTASAAEQA